MTGPPPITGSGITLVGARLVVPLASESAPPVETAPDDPGSVGPVGQVRVVDGRIAAIGPDVARPDDDVIDVSGLLVAPGFVDLQVNGAAGFDLTSEPEAVHQVGATLARHGVTSWLPTIITAEPEAVIRARRALAQAGPAPPGTARPLGLHLEGPFLAPGRRGTHPERWLRSPAGVAADDWLGGPATTGSPDGPGAGATGPAPAPVRVVTVAPELDGALDLIDQLVAAGVVVSLGHSAASRHQAAAAADRGARLVTHLFNAMPSLHHRDPGLVGTALTDPRLTASLIVDGIHVDPTVVDLAWRLLGPDRLVLVSDAVAALDRPGPGHRLGEVELSVDHGAVRNPAGDLAGSVLTLEVAVANLVAASGAPLARAVAAASTTPARLLGFDDLGRLAPGAVADLVVLNDDLEVAATMVSGQLDRVPADRSDDTGGR